MPTLATLVFSAGVLIFSMSVCAQQDWDPDEAGPEASTTIQQHAIAALPPRVMEAARGAAPDVYFQEAESYWSQDHRVYELRGRLIRETWFVTVRDDGRVLRVAADSGD